ncbi:MAG: hypothetical protein P8Z74_19340 [Acidobacteriota bacterium]
MASASAGMTADKIPAASLNCSLRDTRIPGLRQAHWGSIRLWKLGTSYALSGLMRAILFGVEPNDTSTLVVTSAVLLLVALFACWLPARRAAGVDPMRALRME